jgi:transposase
MGYVIGVDREQRVLFPESLDEYVAEENPVRFIDLFVAKLDLAALGFSRSTPAATGRPAYDPADLLRLYIYGYMNRVRSSRRLESEAGRNVELMWLLRKLGPDHKTIADFRKDHPEALREVYRQFNALCRKLQLLGGQRVAVDGSKFVAVNALERNQTQGSAKRALAEAQKRIDRYLGDLDAEDADEEAQAEVRSHLERAMGIKENMEAVLAELKEAGQTQVSRTDPESRRMQVRGGGMAVCYNVQIAVDEKHHLIAAYEVTNDVSDVNQLSAMARAAKAETGGEALEVLADRGYYDGQEIAACVEMGITPSVPKTRTSKNGKKGLYTNERFRYDAENDVYHCPGNQTLAFAGTENLDGRILRYYGNRAACAGCPLRAKCTESKSGRRIKRLPEAALLEAMEQRVKAHPELRTLRLKLAEHPFGTIKRGMDQGHFLTRGRRKTRGEFGLTALAYNLKRALAVRGVRRLIDGLAAWEPLEMPA